MVHPDVGTGSISIIRYTAEFEAAVSRFNARMLDGNASAAFGLPGRAPRDEAVQKGVEVLLASSGSEVHGGIILQQHRGLVPSAGSAPSGADVLVGNLQSPLSEGIIDPQFAGVALRMIRHVLRRTPYLYAVGMGSDENPFAKFLTAAGWTSRRVPFFFRILNARVFTRELQPLRQNALKRSVASAAGVTGAAALALAVVQRSKARTSSYRMLNVTAETESDLADDHAWAVAARRCSFAVHRDSAMLRDFLRERVFRVRVLKRGEPVGWFSMLETQMQKHNQFGTMRVATLIDMVAVDAADLPAFAELATQRAKDHGCDLVVSNQLMLEARQALRTAGFLTYSSNYLAITSPTLSTALADDTAFITRQDGDGLIHL